MSLAQLSQQLTRLSETLKQTNALIARLAHLSFQPGSEPLDEDEDTVRIELAQDIHDSLKQLEEDVELLKQETEDIAATSTLHKRKDSERDREKARLSTHVLRLEEDLGHSRGRFRKAQLSAKRASEEAKRREREIVFKNLTAPPEPVSNGDSGRGTPDLFAGRSRKQQQKQLSRDEQILGASTDVTASLRRTYNLLSTELSRSRFAQETFDQSTAALAELGEHYTNLDSILTNSRNLLGTLLRSQKSDTWYLETAFYILCTVLVWLIFRRLLYGPFIKLPLFLWSLASFAFRWLILKPFWLFLTATGIITTRPAPVGGLKVTQNTSRPPLIVHRSATGGPPSLAMSEREAIQSGAGVPAGMGGAGAKRGKAGTLAGAESEKIAKMAEDSEKQRRGDGTILQDRGDIPKNPKKKAFEADVEDEKHRVRKRDEL